MTQLVQCVPNFSEGRHPDTIAAIVAAVQKTPGVRLADWSADADHNRMVVTFVGEPTPVKKAALAACAVAIEKIDLSAHQGVHPRLGAVDVLPIVPISEITLPECAKIALEIGHELAERHAVPVFFYEAASEVGRTLPDIRKRAFQTIAPDAGPSQPHPTAGATVVGARGPLIAYNVMLDTADVTVAKTIARELRAGGVAGFHGIRALGLTLESQGVAQVSMNLTRPEETPMLSVFQYVTRRAAEMGCAVQGSEVIGAIPGGSAFEIIADALRCSGLMPGQILRENWPHLIPAVPAQALDERHQ